MAWYWALWLIVGFGVPEGIALATRHYENTLSETVWRWAAVTPGQPLWKWTALHLFIALGLLWLWFHIDLKWFR